MSGYRVYFSMKKEIKAPKAVKAWAITSHGLIVPSVKMRLFAIRIDAEKFVLDNYENSTEADIIQVTITPEARNGHALTCKLKV